MDTISLKWNLTEKLIFRFFFMLFGLFMLFFNNGTFPMFYFVAKFENGLLHQFIPWLGKNVFHLPYEITVFTNGSGDTTYDYLVLFCVAASSFVGTLIWSLVDRNSINYNRLFYWLTVAVRFYVGLMLINYGLVKVIQLQFPAPSFSRLLKTYGESSPMGLAWTFLGFSKGYNLFMGIAELMAGLLLFRRTVAVGAIITLMTTANVMAINYFYDVPVKIVSTALVVMCLFLLAPNYVRLFNLFFKGKATVLRMLEAQFISKLWQRITKYTLKFLIIGFAVFGGLTNIFSMDKIYGTAAPRSPLYGAYKVNKFVKNGKELAAADSDSTRWNTLILQEVDRAAIKEGVNFEYTSIFIDTAKKQIKFLFSTDPDHSHPFKYQKKGNQLFLSGKLYNDSLEISLTKMKFLLIDRKLNWINETPYNR